AGLERGAEHPRLGADGERIIIAGKAARQRHEVASPVRLGEGLGAPRRLAALLLRLDPDLEDAGRHRLAVILGMADAGASAHHLHISRLGAALMPEAVLVRDRALPDIGDDLHVRVRMRGKARVGGDLVVVPYSDRAVAEALRVVIAGKGEVVLPLEPAMVRAAEGVEW